MYKPIKNHEEYFINVNGIILDKNNQYVRINQDINGYLYSYLDNEKVLIHDAMAETYLNKSESDYVIHKDSDIMHNHISNLELSDNPEELEDYFYTKKKYGKNHLTKCNKRYSPYIVYNEDKNDYIICDNRNSVAELIEYELISLKNMVGNGRVISIGPYAGYKIDRVTK